MKIERKNFNIESKNINDDGTFSGYASTFDNVDLGGDIVRKGAFLKKLTEKGASNVKMFLQHDSTEIIGTYSKIFEDEKGLYFEGKLFVDNIAKAKETHFLMKEGQLGAVSIGYRTLKSSPDGMGNKNLEEIDLVEISPVTFPMNTLATIDNVKSFEDMTEREFEKSLRDVNGLSQKQAKTLMSEGYAAMNRDDSEQEENQQEEQEEKSSDMADLADFLKNK